MKIIRFQDDDGEIRYGRPLDDTFQKAECLDGELFGRLEPTSTILSVSHLLAPLAPPNILCIGLNYHEHAKETHMDAPERPILFLKPTTTVTGPNTKVTLPDISYQVDYEGELVIVIGKAARNVSEDDALDYVFGYTCANDVSARDWQMQLDKQWCRGKGFDTFCPLGPAIVTSDELLDPGKLSIKTRLNDKLVQDSNTSDLIFPVQHLISYLSQGTTLLPGTVILTGTPPGVGVGRNPPVFLRSGDICEVEIAGIGVLRNTFIGAERTAF